MKKTFLLLTLLFAVACSIARAAALDAPAAEAFTIAVMPDTQHYTGVDTKLTPKSTAPLANEHLATQVRWLTQNIDAQRIVFISHVGDIVDINREVQWALAAELLAPLHGRVPYSLSLGNHDMTEKGDAQLFQRFFPASRFRAFPWYAGTFESKDPKRISGDNANSCQLFSAGGIDFIHVSLECNAPDDVLAWAGALLTRHADRLALITTHMDLGVIEKPKTNEGFYADPQGRMRWAKRHGKRGNTPTQMFEKLYRKHANLRIVFSGDQSRVTALHLTSTGEQGNTVHHCMSDYGSLGPLRLYRFFPARNEVQVITYDPVAGALVEQTKFKPLRSSHQFTLPVDLRRPVRK